MVDESFTGAQAAPAASGYARSIDAVFGKKDMTGFLIVTALGHVVWRVNSTKMRGGHGASLEIVLCDTLNMRAISRVGSPASRRLIASFFWCGGELRRSPHVNAARLGAVAAFARAGAD